MNAIQFSTQERASIVEHAETSNSRTEMASPEPMSESCASTLGNDEMADSFSPSPSISEMSDDQVHRISKAIADPQRFAILASIAEQEELPCKTLVANLSIKQATISHHLKELAAAELIESRKQGQRAILSCRRDVCEAYLRALEGRFLLRSTPDAMKIG